MLKFQAFTAMLMCTHSSHSISLSRLYHPAEVTGASKLFKSWFTKSFHFAIDSKYSLLKVGAECHIHLQAFFSIVFSWAHPQKEILIFLCCENMCCDPHTPQFTDCFFHIWKSLSFIQLLIPKLCYLYFLGGLSSQTLWLFIPPNCSQSSRQFSISSCPQAEVHLRVDFWTLAVGWCPWVLIFAGNHLCLTAACWPTGHKSDVEGLCWHESPIKKQKGSSRCLCFVMEPSHQKRDSEALVMSHAPVWTWPQGLQQGCCGTGTGCCMSHSIRQ